jgi:predicted Zn-dependent protease
MSDLDDAIARLEEAVARLEAASNVAKRAAASEQRGGEQPEDERVRAVAAAIAGRVDAALAKLGQLLERED